MENSTDGILRPCAPEAQPFLTDLLLDDAVEGKKQENWDTRKAYCEQVKDIFETGTPRNKRQAQRITKCSETLFFDWSKVDADGCIKLQFKKAFFCRVRNCPICQWRRSLKLVARFFEALPAIHAAHPTMRYALLTLTVKNCPIDELRATVQAMNKAWKRLSERKIFPALGFVRSLEVTKETDTYDKKTKKLIHKARPNYCHPHFHIILALPFSYFVGRNYLSTAKWAELWQHALRSDYTPVCDVRLVKSKPRVKDGSMVAFEAIVNDLRAALAVFHATETEAALDSLIEALFAARNNDITALFTALENTQKNCSIANLPRIQALVVALKEFESDTVTAGLQAAILETIKYTVKPSDLVQDSAWTLALVDQLHNTRAVAFGGIFKDFLKEEEEESGDSDDQQDDTNPLCFGWRSKIKRYQQNP